MTDSLEPLARPGGGLAMVAMDQRESLATMIDQATGRRPSHAEMVAFKHAVAEVLGPVASAFLIDAYHDVPGAARFLPPTTGLILAADALTQEQGGPVEETALDEAVLATDGLYGAQAIKLLVIWRRDAKREARVELSRRFIQAAAERGVLSVLEPVVRATPAERAAGTWNAEAAAIEAARELSALKPSLYKVQVPLQGKGSPAQQAEASQALGEAIATPWVVLSQGVDRADYRAAVAAACAGGASGFLAGRAVWSDVVGRADVKEALAEVSLPRLRGLVDIVDSSARPWWEA